MLLHFSSINSYNPNYKQTRQAVYAQTNKTGSVRINKQDRQCTHKRNIEARLRNNCCRGKPINITHSECLSVALVSQHGINMRPGILSVVCLVLPYFSTLSYKERFLKNVTKHKMCVLIFFITSVRNILHSKKNSGRYYHKCT
jgi:hypothetical protein